MIVIIQSHYVRFYLRGLKFNIKQESLKNIMDSETTTRPAPIKEYNFDIEALWAYLRKTFDERIVVLDGGMGTQLQSYKLQEEDYRGTI